MPDYGLFALWLGGATVFQDIGRWVMAADPDANAGRGAVEFTDDPARALRFPDAGAALRFWRAQSTVVPLRPDGRPNRPLTAFTCDVRRLP